MAVEQRQGHLVLTVEEATGRTQKDQFTWETNTGSLFEAFVKVEIRGGARNIKAQTTKKSLNGDVITWREDLKLELLEGANELRLMLCREKFQGTKKGTSVIAACGIFINDILEAVPIDKYFELFKPNAGGEGGFIRISLNYVKDVAAPAGVPVAPSLQPAVAAAGQVASAADAANGVQPAAAEGQSVDSGKGLKLPKWLGVVAPVAVAVAATAIGIIAGAKLQHRAQRKRKEQLYA